MKIGWGWGITFFIIAFITFILVMVVMMFRTSSDLYAEDYYKQEVEYQQTIDAKRLGFKYQDSFELYTNNNYLLISYSDFLNSCDSRFVKFYRPSNANLDREFNFETVNDNTLRISLDEFQKGNYEVKYNWSKNGNEYLVKTDVIIE